MSDRFLNYAMAINRGASDDVIDALAAKLVISADDEQPAHFAAFRGDGAAGRSSVTSPEDLIDETGDDVRTGLDDLTDEEQASLVEYQTDADLLAAARTAAVEFRAARRFTAGTGRKPPTINNWIASHPLVLAAKGTAQFLGEGR